MKRNLFRVVVVIAGFLVDVVEVDLEVGVLVERDDERLLGVDDGTPDVDDTVVDRVVTVVDVAFDERIVDVDEGSLLGDVDEVDDRMVDDVDERVVDVAVDDRIVDVGEEGVLGAVDVNRVVVDAVVLKVLSIRNLGVVVVVGSVETIRAIREGPKVVVVLMSWILGVVVGFRVLLRGFGVSPRKVLL